MVNLQSLQKTHIFGSADVAILGENWPFRERLAALLAAPGARDDVACLVADLFLLTLMNVARQQGVPTLALRTGSAASFLCFVAHPMLCDKGYLPPQGTYSSMLPTSLLLACSCHGSMA